MNGPYDSFVHYHRIVCDNVCQFNIIGATCHVDFQTKDDESSGREDKDTSSNVIEKHPISQVYCKDAHSVPPDPTDNDCTALIGG